MLLDYRYIQLKWGLHLKIKKDGLVLQKTHLCITKKSNYPFVSLYLRIFGVFVIKKSNKVIKLHLKENYHVLAFPSFLSLQCFVFVLVQEKMS